MLQWLKRRWRSSTGMMSGPDPFLLSDRVDLDRRLLPAGRLQGSPADYLTAEDTLENSAWWRAIHLIAWIVARTPFAIKLVEMDRRGIRKYPAREHPAYYAVVHQANPDETAMEARFRLVANAVMYGAGYAAIWRDAPGGLRIYPLESPHVRKKYIDYRLFYFRDLYPNDKSVPDDARWSVLPARDVIEISGLRRRGLLAYLTWWQARSSVADGIEASKMRIARTRNSGRPAFALTTPAKLSDDVARRIMKDFQEAHSGYESIGRPPVLDCDLKPIMMPYAPEFKAEEVLSKIPLREIANWTGVPSVLLGDTDGLSYESLDKLIEALFRFGIEPYWTSYEDQVRAKLLTESERRTESHTAEFDRESMAYMTTLERVQMIRALGAGVPIETPNGIRAWMGKPPLDDEQADRLHIPKNIGHDSAGTPAPDKNDRGRPAE